MPRGRPRTYIADAERLEARRAKVRVNVQAFRRREKQKAQFDFEAAATSPGTCTVDGQSREGRILVEQSRLPLKAADSHYIASQPTTSDLLATLSDESSNCRTDSGSCQLSLGISLEPVSQVDFITGALQRRCFPDGSMPIVLLCSPGVRLAQFCSTWISAGATSHTADARLLRSALLASTLSSVGLEIQDTRLVARGFHAQTKAFQNTRRALCALAASSGHSDTTMLAITILFCASTELSINRSWENFSKHMDGVGALVERSGPSRLSRPSARDLFFGYRTFQMPLCYIQRKRSFLAMPQWIGLAWRGGNLLFNDHMQTMLDIAYQIPGEMQDYDESCSKSPEDLRERILRLSQLALQLDEWKVDMEMSCLASPYRIITAKSPGFFTEAIEFTDLTVAMPFTSSCGVRVHLFDLIRQIAEDLSEYPECHDFAQLIVREAISECLKWSRTACQCMESFQVHKSKFKIAGRLNSLFPFDAAWDTFSKLSKTYGMDLRQEVRWCHNLAKRYDSGGLPILCWR
jgi:hypothetical protein